MRCSFRTLSAASCLVWSVDRGFCERYQQVRGVVTVVPITSSTSRVYLFQVFLPADGCGLEHDSKAQAEQIRSIAVARIGRRIGALPPDPLGALDAALRSHFVLWDRLCHVPRTLLEQVVV
jgi:mRNA-degrading endonuclease toxin of MazEF toxin-antitoxin module